MPSVFAIWIVLPFAIPLWVWVVLIVIGGIGWVIEQPRRARQRKRKREARAQLASDLQRPQAPPSLPYGYSGATTGSDSDQQRNPPGPATQARRPAATRQAGRAPAPSPDAGRQHIRCAACNALNYANSGDVPCYACGTALQPS